MFVGFGACVAQIPPPQNLRIAREYFVSPTGNSSNSATASAPWPLSYALAHTQPEALITLLPGVYPSISLSDPVRMSGATLRSQVKWGAKIVGSPGMHGIATEIGVSNVVIDGFEISYPYISGVKLNDNGSTVRNCWIHHAGKGDPASVINTNDSFEGSGIEAHNKLGTVIENNLIEQCGVWIGHDHGIYMNGTNNIVRNNVVRYNLAHGIQVYEVAPQSAANCQFYNNLIYGNGRGLVIYTQAGCTNFVFNNTIITTNSAVEATPILIRRSSYVMATNNICLSPGRSIYSDDGSLFFEDYNLVARHVSGPHDVLAASAGFVNAAQGLYWLGINSPARDAGCAAVIPPVDFFSNIQTAVTDIGAFQYNPAFTLDSRVLDPTPVGGADYWALQNLSAK